jgi:hypothetical protein
MCREDKMALFMRLTERFRRESGLLYKNNKEVNNEQRRNHKNRHDSHRSNGR